MADRLYIVAYDIRDQRRWRKVFKTMKGYGQWLQLSVFQCRLTRKRYMELLARLDSEIDHDNDQIVFLDLGDAERVEPHVESLGIPITTLEKKAKVL